MMANTRSERKPFRCEKHCDPGTFRDDDESDSERDYGADDQYFRRRMPCPHCSTWSTNERTLQSPLSTVCGQYCVAFLMFRCRDASMNAFTRLFTTDLVANDCRVFDWVAAVNKK